MLIDRSPLVWQAFSAATCRASPARADSRRSCAHPVAAVRLRTVQRRVRAREQVLHALHPRRWKDRDADARRHALLRASIALEHVALHLLANALRERHRALGAR